MTEKRIKSSHLAHSNRSNSVLEIEKSQNANEIEQDVILHRLLTASKEDPRLGTLRHSGAIEDVMAHRR